MSVVRKTVTFTEQQDQWIKAQIDSGHFTNDSEYIRSLVREDQKRNAAQHQLKMMIKEGLDSGISDKKIPDIMKEVEAKLKRDGRL